MLSSTRPEWCRTTCRPCRPGIVWCAGCLLGCPVYVALRLRCRATETTCKTCRIVLRLRNPNVGVAGDCVCLGAWFPFWSLGAANTIRAIRKNYVRAGVVQFLSISYRTDVVKFSSSHYPPLISFLIRIRFPLTSLSSSSLSTIMIDYKLLFQHRQTPRLPQYINSLVFRRF